MDKFYFTNDDNHHQDFDVHDKTHLVEDSLINGKQDSRGYVSSNFEINKIKFVFIFILIIFSIIVFRLSYLQLAHGEEYRLAAEENRIRIQNIKATRGIIYDRNKKILAHNIPNFILSFIPADLPENKIGKNNIANEISAIIDISSNEIIEKFNEENNYPYNSYLLIDHIPYQKAILIKIASKDMPGINLNTTSFREYKTSENFSHLLGYTGLVNQKDIEENNYFYDDYTGKSGIELIYENELKGGYGKKEIEVDSLGKESKIVNSTNAIPGNNIILTIDSELQELLGNRLNSMINKNKSITGGAAIAMDPRNGEILSLVSAPSFNNNMFTLGVEMDKYNEIIASEKKPLFNRSISGEYPSGSTIKPIVAIAALEEGIINENTSIMSTGGIQVDKWFFPDWKAGGHGATNITKAIAESVNSFFYTIGGGHEEFDGLGVNTLSAYMKKFGLGDKLGIDLNSEADGFIPTKQWKEEAKGESWYIGDTYHLSIGQGDILVTPLQVAFYTAAIANGGSLFKPHILRSIVNRNNEMIKDVQSTLIKENIAEEKNIDIVKNGLRQAVLTGSARALNDLPFTSAGKTGTAQFGTEKKTHAWFTAFAPYENPEIVITVLVEAGGEGNDTALPIVKEALKFWFEE